MNKDYLTCCRSLFHDLTLEKYNLNVTNRHDKGKDELMSFRQKTIFKFF